MYVLCIFREREEKGDVRCEKRGRENSFEELSHVVMRQSGKLETKVRVNVAVLSYSFLGRNPSLITCLSAKTFI